MNPRNDCFVSVTCITILLFFMINSSVAVYAVNYYVRPDGEAQGNQAGTDWNNAWYGLHNITWNLISPGDTIHLAGGNYSTPLTINKSGTSTSPIAIERALEAPFDAQVIFQNSTHISADFIILDGITDNGIKIKIESEGYIDTHHLIADGSGITLRNLEIEGPGSMQCHAARGIHATSDNLLIDSVFIHDFSAPGIRLSGNENITIVNSKITNIYSAGDEVCQAERGMNIHYEHIAAFDGVKNLDISKTMLSQDYGGPTRAPGSGLSLALLREGYLRLHDNIFFNMAYPIYINSDGLGEVNQYTVVGNTFAGFRVPIGGTPDQVNNNIFCNLPDYFTQSDNRNAYYGGSHNLYCYDLAAYSVHYQNSEESQVLVQNSHPFINYTSDWHLRHPTETGLSLAEYYILDFEDSVRGADGVWDRGAFEYINPQCEKCYHVREGAVGSNNGTDWANAFTSLPVVLNRGATYYIADGNYASYSFNDPANGTQMITIKKATIADHGTSAGWHDSYGDGQAVFIGTNNLWDISTNYWIIDGVTGSGQGIYGFKLDFQGTANSLHGLNIDGSYITIKHVDVQGNGFSAIDSAFAHDGIYVNGVGYTNVTIANSHIHDWKRCGMIFAGGVHDIVIENNFIARTYSTAVAHGQAIQVGGSRDSNYGFKIRNNIFYNVQGSGFIFYLGGVNSIHHDIDVSGNLFWTDEPASWNTATAIGTNDDTTCNNCNVYGNTFFGLTGRSGSGNLELDHGYGSAINNIFYQSNSRFTGNWTATHTSSDDDYTLQPSFQRLSSNPFVNSAAGDFRLLMPTAPGDDSIGPEYSLDMLGNIRGVDGNWDRGAYEYASGQQPETIPGDLNGDRRVNLADLQIIAASFGKNTGETGYSAASDLNNDNTINLFDVMVVVRNWG